MARILLLCMLALTGTAGLAGPVKAEGTPGWPIHLDASQLQPGGLLRIELEPDGSLVAAHAIWEQTRIPLVPLAGANRLAAFLGIPRDTKPGPVTLQLALTDTRGQNHLHSLPLVVQPREFPIQRLKVAESYVSPAPEILARHQREQAEVRAALTGSRPEQLWRQPFRKPLQGDVSSPFGVQRVFNDEPRSTHSGVDLRAPSGHPVAAASDGLVILTGDHYFSGRSVYIDHGMGLITMYFHLSEILVENGQQVTGGQIIGRVGSTGRSTGPHLHWGLRVHDCRVDPLALPALFTP
jgi:murein DD-endopeptidase MepM/ murein hydrolase activator NlpD